MNALDAADFVSHEQEHNDFEAGAFGDARRCPRHPVVKTSSDDGFFDTAGCHMCEAASEDADRAWDVSPDNVRRSQCNDGAGAPWGGTWRGISCVVDDCPF